MSVAVPMFGRALMRIVTPMSGSLFWSLTTPVMRVIFRGVAAAAATERQMTICLPESFQVLSVPANNCFRTAEMG